MVVIALCSGLAALAIALSIVPNLRHISTLNTGLTAERTKLETLYQQSKQGRSVQERLKKIEPEIFYISDLFLLLGNELSFIETMEQIAEKHRLAIKLELDNRSEQDSSIGATPRIVILTLQGAFQDLYQYVIALEKQPFAFTFLSLSMKAEEGAVSRMIPRTRLQPLSPQETKAQSPAVLEKMLTVRIEGKTYWQPAHIQ